MALRAGANFGLLVLVLEEWPDDVAALDAVVFDHVELGQNPAAPAHNPAGPDELIEVELPQVPQVLHQRQVRDTNFDVLKTRTKMVRIDKKLICYYLDADMTKGFNGFKLRSNEVHFLFGIYFILLTILSTSCRSDRLPLTVQSPLNSHPS